ncbi:MAG: hypothetical protein ABSA83_17105 [Verrucomicrobiota bacterium]|jgi:MFS family permease/predicted RNA-binding Zn-ribbon protein involved in translation (DUF1610 family)
MKKFPETPFDKPLDYSIACLFSGMALESFALLMPHQTTLQPGLFTFSVSIGCLAILGLGLACLWRQLFRKDQKPFTIAGIVCGVMFIAQRLLQGINTMPDEVQHKVLSVCFSVPVLLSLWLVVFLALRQFWKKFNNGNGPRNLLAGIGTVLLVAAIASIAIWPLSFAFILCGVIGLGCVCREPIMGVVVFWVSLAIWILSSSMAVSAGAAFMPFVGFAFVMIALAIVLNKFLKDEFRWEPARKAWMEMNRPSTSSGFRSYNSRPSFSFSKSCSGCGRQVSIAAHAGQRCPHCGVYWSSERQNGFRY